MAAGLGFKTFTTGEVLTAADTNGYLMQGVLVFASAAARDAAITSPQEGQFAYLKDTNVTTYYTGSAWTNLDTTGMTNPMTTTGDMVYSSSGSTPARLGIGTTGQVVTVAGGIPSWATPATAASGITLIQRSTFSAVANTSTTFDGIFTSTYKTYLLVIENCSAASVNDDFLMQYRYSGTTQVGGYYDQSMKAAGGGTTFSSVSAAGAVNFYTLTSETGGTGDPTQGQLFINNPVSSSPKVTHRGQLTNGQPGFYLNGGFNDTARTYTGLIFSSSSSNISGTIAVYGLATA